jgi:hypothetical protein
VAGGPEYNPVGTYSLDKSKIKFLLLEGVHEQAREVIGGHGYSEIELRDIPATIRDRLVH